MRLMLLLAMVSAAVHAQVSSTLSASIVAAEQVDPILFKTIKTRLTKIKSACDEAPKRLKVAKEKVRLMTFKEYSEDRAYLGRIQSDINRALELEINRIDKNINLEQGCLTMLMVLNIGQFAEKEGLNYLRSVQADVKKQDYKECSKKLGELLKEGSHEN